MLKLASIALLAASGCLFAIHPSHAQTYQQQQIGPFGYTYGSNGYVGTSQQIGNTGYYHDNRGTTCIQQRIGTMVTTNCY